MPVTDCTWIWRAVEQRQWMEKSPRSKKHKWWRHSRVRQRSVGCLSREENHSWLETNCENRLIETYLEYWIHQLEQWRERFNRDYSAKRSIRYTWIGWIVFLDHFTSSVVQWPQNDSTDQWNEARHNSNQKRRTNLMRSRSVLIQGIVDPMNGVHIH